jgi:hypothetical protein
VAAEPAPVDHARAAPGRAVLAPVAPVRDAEAPAARTGVAHVPADPADPAALRSAARAVIGPAETVARGAMIAAHAATIVDRNARSATVRRVRCRRPRR